ncbi:MAG: hypothetical protein OFPII_14960 [Osedax symbiont Rs1]|nr:MAG: hypothetical protein OFPII_14960 [Osedax symbiont Rs1]
MVSDTKSTYCPEQKGQRGSGLVFCLLLKGVVLKQKKRGQKTRPDPDSPEEIVSNREGVQTRYLHQDALGSVDLITDAHANVVDKRSFDAWGKMRDLPWEAQASLDDPLYLTQLPFTNKAFTGHENIQEVGLIHMNGRVYDAHLGRFVGSDPYIQAGNLSQNFNRYSYVMNTPLRYTDPSGFRFGEERIRSSGKLNGSDKYSHRSEHDDKDHTKPLKWKKAKINDTNIRKGSINQLGKKFKGSIIGGSQVSSLLDKRYGDKKELTKMQRVNYGDTGLILTAGIFTPCSVLCGTSATVIEFRLGLDTVINPDVRSTIMNSVPRIADALAEGIFSKVSRMGEISEKALSNINSAYGLGVALAIKQDDHGE